MSTLADSLKTAVATNAASLERMVDEVLARHVGAESVAPAWHSPLEGVEAELATKAHPVWAEVAPSGGRPGFLATEFTNPWLMDVGFLRLLHRIRLDIWEAWQAGDLQFDVPMRVISDSRKDGGASSSEHHNVPCRAIDLQVWNAYERAVLCIAAIRRDVVRLGSYPGRDRRGEVGMPSHANDAAGLHLDASTVNPSPRVWTRF